MSPVAPPSPAPQRLTSRNRLPFAGQIKLNTCQPPWDSKSNAAQLCSGPCLAGVNLLSLDGRRAICCCAEALEFPQVRRFLRLAKWVYKAHGAVCGYRAIPCFIRRCHCFAVLSAGCFFGVPSVMTCHGQQ